MKMRFWKDNSYK